MVSRRYRTDEDASLIELTPMIDVVFLLLIFFMVSAQVFDPHGYDVELPETTAAPKSEGLSDSLVVIVQKNGTAIINGKELKETDSLPVLSKQQSVVLRADRQASHGDVMTWMDKLQAAGIEAVTLASSPKSLSGKNADRP